VKPQILDALRARRLAKAKSTYLQSLRKDRNIAILLTPPRAVVSVKDAPVRGRQDAPVQIVEFADYECPYCQQAEPALDRLISEYKGKVSFSFKDTPLPMHPHAQKASEAGQCANAQGKFWEYHDLLFKSKELELPQLKEQARKLQMDGAAFDKCLDSGEMADSVKAQLGEAEKLGLQGTPSFFINGRFYSGAMTYEALQAAVQEELAKSAVQEKVTAKR
jgi:protein-disulfide isomerase